MQWRRIIIRAFLMLWLGATVADLGQLLGAENEPVRPPAGKNRKLSPQERKQLQERYRRFKQLSPEEQERLRRRQKEFESLPDDQKEQLRRRGRSIA